MRASVALTAVLLVAAAACGGGDGPVTPEEAGTVESSIEVASSDLLPGNEIPADYTCDGDDTAPTLSWSGVPGAAEALVLVLEDPDAPSGAFVHWLVAGIPPETERLLPGGVPAGAVQGTNGFGDTGYGGPCPPEGDEPHRYVFRVLAVDAELGLEEGFSRDDLTAALEGRAIAQGELVATYGR